MGDRRDVDLIDLINEQRRTNDLLVHISEQINSATASAKNEYRFWVLAVAGSIALAVFGETVWKWLIKGG